MGIRTVRLDEETEKVLAEIVTATGLSVSGAMKKGLRVLLMEQYADLPMDLADASLVVAAEALTATRVFTIDRQDFLTDRVRRGHRSAKLEIIG